MIRMNAMMCNRIAQPIGARFCATTPKNHEEVMLKLQEICKQQRETNTALHGRIQQLEIRVKQGADDLGWGLCWLAVMCSAQAFMIMAHQGMCRSARK